MILIPEGAQHWLLKAGHVLLLQQVVGSTGVLPHGLDEACLLKSCR